MRHLVLLATLLLALGAAIPLRQAAASPLGSAVRASFQANGPQVICPGSGSPC